MFELFDSIYSTTDAWSFANASLYIVMLISTTEDCSAFSKIKQINSINTWDDNANHFLTYH